MRLKEAEKAFQDDVIARKSLPAQHCVQDMIVRNQSAWANRRAPTTDIRNTVSE
jgi:hypothetical protein